MSLYLTFNAFSRRIQPRLPRERERWIDIYIYTRIITVRGRTINTGERKKEEREEDTYPPPAVGPIERNRKPE